MSAFLPANHWPSINFHPEDAMYFISGTGDGHDLAVVVPYREVLDVFRAWFGEDGDGEVPYYDDFCDEEEWSGNTLSLSGEDFSISVVELASPEAGDTALELREVEQSLAYERAELLLWDECLPAAQDGAMTYLDTRSAACDVTDCVKYLQSRRLLDLHSEHPHWVSVRDESEPLPEGQGGY